MRVALCLVCALALACGSSVDRDRDGFAERVDCDDRHPGVHPDSTEVPYDGLDNDCDPATADDDLDGDGVGALEGDCDDRDPARHPFADDVPYDGVDQDCSGTDDDDLDGDGYAGGDGGPDCDDTRADVSPAGVERCGDGVDHDCDGADPHCDLVDRDGDGTSSAEGDCRDDDPLVGPHAEERPYDGVDQDCDEATPDDDLDRDGWPLASDCDDTAPTTHPFAEEVPYDGVDQDCRDGDLVDVDMDGFDVDVDCDDEDADRHPNAVEIPFDAIDQNCDGRDTIGDVVTVDALWRTQVWSFAWDGAHFVVALERSGTPQHELLWFRPDGTVVDRRTTNARCRLTSIDGVVYAYGVWEDALWMAEARRSDFSPIETPSELGPVRDAYYAGHRVIASFGDETVQALGSRTTFRSDVLDPPAWVFHAAGDDALTVALQSGSRATFGEWDVDGLVRSTTASVDFAWDIMPRWQVAHDSRDGSWLVLFQYAHVTLAADGSTTSHPNADSAHTRLVETSDGPRVLQRRSPRVLEAYELRNGLPADRHDVLAVPISTSFGLGMTVRGPGGDTWMLDGSRLLRLELQ